MARASLASVLAVLTISISAAFTDRPGKPPGADGQPATCSILLDGTGVYAQMFAQTRIATGVALAHLIGSPAAADGHDPDANPVIRALRFFEERAESEPVAMLKTLRPAPLPLAAREVVLANLPLEGEVQPDKIGRAKLGLLRGLLDLHERDRVFEIKVIDVVQAFVGLHARTAILISDRALQLLTAQELQAVLGHEMGHEYFWADYDRAVESGDPCRRHEIELRCDGIAVLTARALNLDRHHLCSAFRKLERFNDTLGVLDVTNYPSVEDRERFIEALVRSLDERAARAHTYFAERRPAPVGPSDVRDVGVTATKSSFTPRSM